MLVPSRPPPYCLLYPWRKKVPRLSEGLCMAFVRLLFGLSTQLYISLVEVWYVRLVFTNPRQRQSEFFCLSIFLSVNLLIRPRPLTKKKNVRDLKIGIHTSLGHIYNFFCEKVIMKIVWLEKTYPYTWTFPISPWLSCIILVWLWRHTRGCL